MEFIIPPGRTTIRIWGFNPQEWFGCLEIITYFLLTGEEEDMVTERINSYFYNYGLQRESERERKRGIIMNNLDIGTD